MCEIIDRKDVYMSVSLVHIGFSSLQPVYQLTFWFCIHLAYWLMEMPKISVVSDSVFCTLQLDPGHSRGVGEGVGLGVDL